MPGSRLPSARDLQPLAPLAGWLSIGSLAFLLFSSDRARPAQPSPSASAPAPVVATQSQLTKDQARRLAVFGSDQLHLGRPAEALANCESALKVDPADETARKCAEDAYRMTIDQDLNNAQAKLLTGDGKGAADLASGWAVDGSARPDQRARAQEIVAAARPRRSTAILNMIVPEWLRQTLVTIAVVVMLALLLAIARKLWREWLRGKWYGRLTNVTKWAMERLQAHPGTTRNQAGIATDAVLDAFSRIGPELNRPLWDPKLLLLRPTPPTDFEPGIISEFLSDDLPSITMAPEAGDLHIEWQLHDVQMSKAIENLQLKATPAVDVGSVARFLRGIVEWFNAGAPRISGVAQIREDKSVGIHLAAYGGRVPCVSVTTFTDYESGIDPLQLSAERAAFKFLFRMKYPARTNDEIDGYSALRQGAAQFAEFAGTVASGGDDARKREASLKKAAFNLSFFRASIPPHVTNGSGSCEGTSLHITDEVRQSVLLAEGVANSLIGTEAHRTAAIYCFRQLQDWPTGRNPTSFQLQAAYNEALVWRDRGHMQRCVLMLTELLGERAPDTEPPNCKIKDAYPKPKLTPGIRFPARVARLAAFARYTRQDWDTLPKDRVKLLIDDAEQLVKDLEALCARDTGVHDHRLAHYMYTEALRSAGHVELLKAVTGGAAALYQDCGRPTGILDSAVTPEVAEQLQQAIMTMRTGEQLAPTCELYCDLAEANLLLRSFTAAQGYARHATLNGPYVERAWYLAAESYFLEHLAQRSESALRLARSYAESFTGEVRLREFRCLLDALGLNRSTVIDLGSRAASASR